MKATKKKENSIRARLTIYGINELERCELSWFKKWIKEQYLEFSKLDKKKQKNYSNRFRATLYKFKV